MKINLANTVEDEVMEESRKRYRQLDYAKALGILLVVLGHTIYEISKNGINTNFGNHLNNWIYCFHMPLFFVLSGLGLYLKYKEYKSIDFFKEINNLSQKLLIPYAFWSFFYLIGTILSSVVITKKIIISMILGRIYSFITLRGAAPIWFLSALFLANI